MQKICLIVIVVGILFVDIQGQIKGSTQKGKLFPDQKRSSDSTYNDILPPQIEINYPIFNPGDTVVVRENFLKIQGRLIDNNNIKNVFINNDLAYIKAKEFSNDILLSPGINKLIVKAIDEFNNSSELEMLVYYQKDINGPVISISIPTNIESQIVVDTTIYEISFQVTDESRVKNLFVNNMKVTDSENGLYKIKIPLNEGKNVISIQAIDIFNNSSQQNIVFNNLADLTGPIVKIIEPAPSRGLKIVHRSEIIQVKGYAEDISGLLEVTVNNRKADLREDGTFIISYYLQTGDNELIVRAIDKKYNQTIDTVIIYKSINEMVSAGKFVSLIIGINSYDGVYWKPLNTAVNDASELGKVLQDKYNFTKVTRLLDKEATREKIIQELEQLTDTNYISQNDNVLIYYAGHGQIKLNEGYWVPADAKNNSIANYIANETIKTFIGNIPAKHILLISDACFAGDIFRGEKVNDVVFDPNNMEDYYRELYRKPSRIAITSGGIEEVMDGGKENHSIFTYYLLNTLKNNDKKYITATEVFDNFKNAVKMNSNQKPQCQYLKNVGDEGGEFIFVLK